MVWTIEFQEKPINQHEKLGKTNATQIISFLTDRIALDEDPRRSGTALRGSELGNYWRYRVFGYRILCDIQDHKLVVVVIEIGHLPKKSIAEP